MAHSMAEADLRDVLPRIEVPTLLLCGELDQRSPLQLAAELAARIPAAELVVIPGVGHISNAEAPETFNACVREFLWSLDGERRSKPARRPIQRHWCTRTGEPQAANVRSPQANQNTEVGGG
jgi:alpha-beta hydrolase superfamily lysophospholipase